MTMKRVPKQLEAILPARFPSPGSHCPRSYSYTYDRAGIIGVTLLFVCICGCDGCGKSNQYVKDEAK